MAFAPISHLIILAAGIAAWLVGGIYYGVLGKPWMAALGKTKDELRPGGKMPILPMLISFVADLIIAFVMAGAIGHLGPGNVTLKNGLISAAILWFGFAVTTMATNNAFGQRSFALTVIDSGHWLLAFLVAGAVLGGFGGA
ncbi:DUF1761 domain-containing protein [Methylovirgula sp. 4M-Z18]|uniref:DUF1761 domain-containing protein n=1 Tax=Methylovirgula sp. 4M-Z18 TaxID=2293567 RepID=UPI0013140DB6|nr:DUF1761 domain-containing protein [Methylovirgula sp. 4M-Z18]